MPFVRIDAHGGGTDDDRLDALGRAVHDAWWKPSASRPTTASRS